MSAVDVDCRCAAYAQLASDLCVAILRFIESPEGASIASGAVAIPDPANDNTIPIRSEVLPPQDGMTLKEIEMELHLKEKQIVTLRRLWGFPQPWHRGGKLFFSRREVRRWASSQPNQANLAAVLRLRRRDVRSPKRKQ